MGVSIEHHEHNEDDLYVFALNALGEKYTVVLKDTENSYSIKYILLPTSDWDVDNFQEAMEVRDEALEYVDEEVDVAVLNGCMTMGQIIPLSAWKDVDVDTELVESVDIELDSDHVET